eukprot:SAG31_NODE_19214_length_609_cov_0.905882_1_plen_84_part_00
MSARETWAGCSASAGESVATIYYNSLRPMSTMVASTSLLRYNTCYTTFVYKRKHRPNHNIVTSINRVLANVVVELVARFMEHR